MSGDGVKTTREQRKRSQRNKIVSVLTGVAASAVAIEQQAPGVVPPGVGVVVSQVAGLGALLVNLFYPK
jgi:hypothetical protein